MLNRESPVPLYHQLIQQLRHDIEEGSWSPGTLIPSERELCNTYEVSRGTARQALLHLEHEGLIRRRTGKGTFVAKPRFTAYKFDSFSKDLQGRGITPAFQVLALEKLPPDPAVRKAMRLPVGALIYRLIRLLLGDNEPYGLATHHLPEQLVPNLESVDLESGFLWDILVDTYKIALNHATETITASVVDRFEAEALGVPRRSPAILVKRVVRTNQNLFLLHRLVMRADKCSYTMDYDYAGGYPDLSGRMVLK